MDASTHFAQAVCFLMCCCFPNFFFFKNEKFIDEDFEGALEHYNKCIELDKSKAEYFVKRSAWFGVF